MDLTGAKTVTDLVVENYEAADIFKKYGIDFCCAGDETVAQICYRKDLDYEQIKAELLLLDNQESRSKDFENWEFDFLVDYIVQRHHSYLMENIPLISDYTGSVEKIHGESHPETIKVKQFLRVAAEELSLHIHKEEYILFPFIKRIGYVRRNGLPLPQPPFDTMKNPLA